jgi:DNA (cytosine-5)-methyltransferase 1
MRAISLFAGAGGMDLGFAQAGFDIVWANDIWPDAVKTYRYNLGDHIFCGDIATVKPADLPDADIMIGGFPCQGFSLANRKRHSGDTRNTLYLEFLRILNGKKPKFFLAENVKGILSLGGGEIFRMIVADFESAGYVVQHGVLNAADYGVPQRRERVFFFGKRLDVQVDFQFPPPVTHAPRGLAELTGQKPWVSIGEALCSVPDPDGPHSLHNHEYTRYKLRFNGQQGHRVIRPDMPAPTITARGDDRGGVVIHHHPNNKRRLSARETAVVQSFPLDYIFYGPKTSAYRQIANAVPPLLAKAIAMWLLESANCSKSQEETE